MRKNIIGNFIKTERKKLGLTQVEFALKSGLGLRFVKELEQGKATVRVDKVNQALEFLGATLAPVRVDYSAMHVNTPESVIILEVESICRRNGVKHLYLYGSYAKGTNTKTSDLDFAIKGFRGDFDKLIEEVEGIRTLKEIDIVNYDLIGSDLLKEDIDKYGRKIY